MMTSSEVRMSGREADAYFTDLATKIVYTSVGHSFHTSKRNPWLNYCRRCGLVYSNNRSTQKAIKAGCKTWRFKDA